MDPTPTGTTVGSLVGGQECRSGRPRGVIDPATGLPVAEALDATPDDVAGALTLARDGLARWRATPATERARVLAAAADGLAARSTTIARLITAEQGKPLREALAEVRASVACLRWFAGESHRLYGRVVPVGVTGETVTVELEPVGVVAALVPWSFPVGTAVRKLAAALAAGCAVVWKPAPQTPRTALTVARAILGAGVPADTLTVLLGDPVAVGTALATAPEVDMVSFTGSVALGRRLAEAAVAGGRRLSLDLGGHAPVVVLDDADPVATARSVVHAKFRNAGQVCIAPSRVYVHARLHRALVDELAHRARRLAVGPGEDQANDMGPLATARRLRAVAALVDDALARGARLVTGGRRPIVDRTTGYWYAPTVLDDVDDDASVMREEPFGPVLPVVVYTDLDEVLQRANATRPGLAGFVYGRDLGRAQAAATALDVGMTGVNTALLVREDGPFGVVRPSAPGRDHGTGGLHEYLTSRYRVVAPAVTAPSDPAGPPPAVPGAA